MQTEDGYIVNKCLQGEKGSFGLLVDKYREGVYALAYYKLRNFQDAEDVTQEVFVKVYRKLHTLRRWDNFMAWIYAVTSNTCKDWIRSQSRRRDHESIGNQDLQTLDQLSMDSHRENTVFESLHEALDSLPQTYQQALTLHYLGGMKVMEMAKFLGTSPSTIARRLREAKAQLREEMLAMMNATYQQQKLPLGFTFRIVEAVKRIRVRPIPRIAGVPWGLSIAAGIILTVLSLSPRQSILDSLVRPAGLLSTGETKAMRMEEIPVNILRMPQMSPMSSKQGEGDSQEPGFVGEQNALFLAPRGESDAFPDKPSARLGKGMTRFGDMTYSPDGKLIAIAGGTGIWLYDATDMTEVGLLQGHNSPVGSVDFSPDSKLLVSTGWMDKTIRIWNVETQEQIGLIGGQKEFMESVLFSPDGKLLALIGGWDRQNEYESAVRLWDVETRKSVAVMEGHKKGKEVYSVSFSPDGKLLATACMDGTARVWNLEEYTEAAVIAGDFGGVLFSPDGKRLILGGIDGVIRLWDVAERKDKAVLKGHDAMVLGLSFSQDGKLLASSDSKQTIRLWDMEKQEQVAVLDGYDNYITGISFSPDGKRLAISIWGGEFQIWDVAEQKEVAAIEGYSGYVWDMSFSPDGRLIASGEDSVVRLWDVETREEVAVLDGFSSLSFSPDGKMLASKGGDNTIIKLWDMEELKEIGVLNNEDKLENILFSPDGKLLASGSREGPVRIWDVEKRERIDELEVPAGGLNPGAFSPDGELLACITDDNTIWLWNVEKEREVATLRGHTGYVAGTVFSPDGKLLVSGGYDRTIRLWDIEDPKRPFAAVIINTYMMDTLCLSPDGKFIVSGERDNNIKIWDVDKKKRIATLKGHTWYVSSLSFSPDGKWLASGSFDGTVLLWEMNLDILQDGRPVEPKSKELGTWGEVKKTKLLQNFPNPFNPETWIPYRLAQKEDVAIMIYNASGQLVKMLDVGHKPAGAYISKAEAAHWDGRNDSGEQVASGVFFYTIQAGDYQATRKMIVAR